MRVRERHQHLALDTRGERDSGRRDARCDGRGRQSRRRCAAAICRCSVRMPIVSVPAGIAASGMRRGRKEIDLRRAEPAGDITIARIFINFARRAELKQFAVPDDADARGHGHGLDLIVGHVEDRGAELDLNPLQLQPQLGAQFGVERRQRLVHQIDRRDREPAHARSRPAAFRRRKGASPGFQACSPICNSSAVCSTRLRIAGFGNAAGRRAQRKSEIVVNGQVRIKRILLKDESDIARSRRIARDVAAVDGDRACVGTLETGNQAQRRCLTGAARAQQHDKLAVIDRQATGRGPHRCGRSAC